MSPVLGFFSLDVIMKKGSDKKKVEGTLKLCFKKIILCLLVAGLQVALTLDLTAVTWSNDFQDKESKVFEDYSRILSEKVR